MGRGRHTPRGRGADDGDGWDEHGNPAWDDERGTQEWLNDPALFAEPAPAAVPPEEPAASTWPRAWERPSAVMSATGPPPPPADPFPHTGQMAAVGSLPEAGDPFPHTGQMTAVGPFPEARGTRAEPSAGETGAYPHTGEILRVGRVPGPEAGRRAPEPGGRRRARRTDRHTGTGQRKGRRGRSIAVMSAVAVAMAVTATVIGVKLSSTRLDMTTTDCPEGRACASVAQGVPSAGAGTDLGDGPTTDPSVTDPASPDTESPTGSADPTAPQGTRRREPSTRPTPQRTRATPTPRPSTADRSTPESDPTPKQQQNGTPENPRATQDSEPLRTSEPSITAQPTQPQQSPEVSPMSDDGRPITPGRVAVDFGVADLSDTGYTGRLSVVNTGPALDGWTLRVPVGGVVTAARGAIWEQDGDTLVLTSADPLGVDESIVISFTADGDATVPGTCGLAEGRCQISADPDGAGIRG
ncbi:hypothetical protein DQ384_06710 [Sphaerisporangium album]|uniref:CBM2 domain-containing protein n=1 Tax=Sphaerisporangium album TaxID=509200 RepID=A0A367FR72_9ACTN|nr:hypothetical protein [Sphaerisporangium album]RCG32190.1 hypothetical protein DQ384_06710 [Sphaerisporangium album]